MEIEQGVQQAVPSLEPWLGTRLRARLLEPGIPVASSGGTIATNNPKKLVLHTEKIIYVYVSDRPAAQRETCAAG